MKTVDVICPACGHSYAAPAQADGAMVSCPNCTVTTPNSPLLSTKAGPTAVTAAGKPSTLPELEHIDEFGRGGMGAVERFLREPRVTACLDHPSRPYSTPVTTKTARPIS